MGGGAGMKELVIDMPWQLESLGAPRTPTPRTAAELDRSGFEGAAGRILDDCAKFATMSVPLAAYLREPLTPREVSRIARSMPLCKEEEFEDDEDTTAYRSCAEEFKKIIESDEDDDLLQLDGAEALICHQLSDGAEALMCHQLSDATSSAFWKEPDQAVIIVDWDDTLFPTSWLSEKPEFRAWQKNWSSDNQMPKLSAEDLNELQQLDQAARSFVTAASALGQVCCVTLSRRPWQQNTMKAFLPKLSQVWEDGGIQVVYASDTFVLQQGHMTTECRHTTGLALAEKQALMTEQSMKKKEAAMQRVIRKAYNGKSWKNVVSVGDGDAEFNAMRNISFKHVNPVGHSGDQKSFRMKAVQMLDGPECSELITQLQILQAWMPALMSLDDDFFVTLRDSEEDIMAMHQVLLERLGD